jgi:outer membrane murein-binding lipoprotein Lpp
MKLATLAVVVIVAVAVGAAAQKKPTYKQLEESNASLTETVKRLERKVLQLERQLQAAEEERAEYRAHILPKITPEIEAAIKKGELVLGMALVDANRALGTKGRLVAEDEWGQTFEWAVEKPEVRESGAGQITQRAERFTATATFDKKGRLSRHWR